MLVVCDAIYPIQKDQLEKPTVELCLPLFSHGISSSFFLAPGISAKKNGWKRLAPVEKATFPGFRRGHFFSTTPWWLGLSGATFIVLFWYDATHDVATLQLEHWYIWRRNWFTLVWKKRLICEKSTFAKIGSAIAVVKPGCCLDHPIYGNTEAVLNAVPSARTAVGANKILFLRREKELGRRGCSWQNRCAAERLFRFIDIFVYNCI